MSRQSVPSHTSSTSKNHKQVADNEANSIWGIYIGEVRRVADENKNGTITVNNNVSTGSSLGYTQFGSNRAMGIVPGQTTIDNYSYYGALQSKGGNYMPVTADFSAFRK